VPQWGWPHSSFAQTSGTRKLESLGYRVELYAWSYLYPFWHNTGLWWTNGQTTHTKTANIRASIVSHGYKWTRITRWTQNLELTCDLPVNVSTSSSSSSSWRGRGWSTTFPSASTVSASTELGYNSYTTKPIHSILKIQLYSTASTCTVQ